MVEINPVQLHQDESWIPELLSMVLERYVNFFDMIKITEMNQS